VLDKDYFTQLCFPLTNNGEKFSSPVNRVLTFCCFSRVLVCSYDIMYSIENILKNLKDVKI